MAHSSPQSSQWRTGVFLRPDPTGGRIWVQNIEIDNKRRTIELGRLPQMRLPEARAKAEQNLQKLEAGVNLLSQRRRSHEQHLKQQISDLSSRLKESANTESPEVEDVIAHSSKEAVTDLKPRTPARRSRVLPKVTKNKTDHLPPARLAREATPATVQSHSHPPTIAHANIRGRDYFDQKD